MVAYTTIGDQPITLDHHGHYLIHADARPLTLADYASTLDDTATCKTALDAATDPVTIDYLSGEYDDLISEADAISAAFATVTH